LSNNEIFYLDTSVSLYIVIYVNNIVTIAFDDNIFPFAIQFMTVLKLPIRK